MKQLTHNEVLGELNEIFKRNFVSSRLNLLLDYPNLAFFFKDSFVIDYSFNEEQEFHKKTQVDERYKKKSLIFFNPVLNKKMTFLNDWKSFENLRCPECSMGHGTLGFKIEYPISTEEEKWNDNLLRLELFSDFYCFFDEKIKKEVMKKYVKRIK